MKKAIIAVILLIVLCAVLISCNGVKIGINFYVDGEFYEGVRTKGEEEIKMPDDPVKEGYVFQGWYWDEGTWTQPFTAASFLNQSISEAFKVYAYFISEEELASTKLISFETMGAGAVNPVRIKVGELISEPQGLSRPGYYLVGWYREADFTTKWNFATDRVSSDMTLYAKWVSSSDMAGAEIIAGDMTVSGRNASIRIPNASETFSFSEHIAVSPYAVYGIYNDQACTDEIPSGIVNVNVGDNVFYIMVTSGNGSNKSVYTADVYRRHMYSVTYRYNNGTADKVVPAEEDGLIAAEDPGTKTGYTFTGWGDWNFGSDTVSDNVLLEAEWTANEYDVTFDSALGSAVEAVKVTYDEEYTWSVPERTGYTFLGWSDGEKMLTDASGASLSVWNAAENTAVVAVWEVIEYSVSYENLKGAANSNVVKYTIEDEITFAALAQDGYTFIEWVDENGSAIEGISKGSIGNRVISAVWELIGYTATFFADGVKVADIPFNVETVSVTEPEIPAKTGYNAEWEDYSFIAQNITVNAVYTPVIYKVIYNVAGAYDVDKPVNTNPTSYTIEDETITLVPASKTGYTFVKWTKDGEDITEIAQGSYGDITITAVWQTVTYTLDMVMENDEGGYDGHYEGEENRTSFTVEDEFTFIEPICDIRGYEFKGWYTLKNDGDKVEGIALGTVGNKTYYARWQRSEYTIVYRNTENAVNGNPTSYNVESESITLTDPSKTGYTFAGWYSDSDLSQVADTTIETGSIGNLEFYAKWNAIVYSIDYVLYEGVNGDNPTSYTIEDEITLCAATRDGYSFGGWFTDSAFENAIDKIALGSTGNMTLYAKWYYTGTVSFVTNGGSAIESVTQEYGTVLVAPEDPTREHYTFAGWYSDEALQNEYVFSTMPDIDFTLYAKWEAVEYSITYVLNGGENGLNPDVYTVESAFDFAEATKTGYTFVAWYTLPDFTSAPVSSIVAGTFGNMTLYANYSINSYTISFDSAGGSAVAPVTQEYDTAVSAPPAPTRNGYGFNGWLTEEGEAFVFDKIPAYDVALTADWELIRYTITYNLNGGVNASANPAYYTIEDETVTFAAPTRRGYTFEGWFADSEYAVEITSVPAGSYGVIEVEAKWAIIVYDITYYNVDGLENPNPGTYTVEDVVSFAEVFKLGHTFGGFFKEEGFVTPVTGIAEGSIGDVAVYAKYTVNTYEVWLDGKDEADYTVSFDLGGALGSIASQHIAGDTALEYPAIPQRSGYMFGGWYQSEDCTGNAYDFTSSVRSDITLYAKWIEISNTAITIGDSVSVSVEGTTLHYYDFVPLVSGDISVTTTGTVDTFGYLYDGDGTLLRSNDDGSDSTNFLINYNVTAGEKYTIAFRGYGKASSGESILYLSGNNTVAAGGTAAESGIMREITFGTSFTLPVPEAREGYVFRGWADADGTMYTDAEGNGIRVFDKGEETVLVSMWEVDGFDITFVTNGGTAVETVTIPRGGRVDINSFVTTRSGYSFLGWYLSAGDSEPYNATVMPDYDFTLYAKWTAYALDPIKYDGSISAATSLREVTADDFGATCFDNGGNLVPITVTLTTQTAGETATVRLTATSNGKTKTATIQNVKIYGAPTLTFDDGVTYFNLKDGLTADWFTASGTDTYGEATEIRFEIEGDYAAGDIVTVIVRSVDPAGNVTSGSVENVMVYGLPVITYNEEKGEISVNDVLSAELLSATAVDSFDESLNVSVTLSSGTVQAGNTVTLTLTATDKYGNTTVINKDFAVYGMPTISNAETLEFRVEDEITTESLGITALDTYGAALEISLAVKEGAQSAGVTMIWTATVTDIAGNVTTKDYSVRIYGTPVITYDREGLKVTEDATVVNGAEKYLNAYAYDSFGNKLTLTASVSGGELAGGGHIAYTLTAADHLGNVSTITTAAIPVYDVEDISLSYDAFSTDIIKLTSKGEEFAASATDTFGEACDITIERAGGGAIVAGEVQDIVIVATDRAGNRYVSETVSGIKVYGMPTAALTYPDNGYTVSENDDISFLFIVRDSFGGQIYAEIASDAPLVAGNAVNITVTATDDAGNVFEGTYLFGVLPAEDPFVTLMVSDALWQSLFVTDNVLPLPTVDGMVFYGWFDGNGTRFTDEAGNLLVTPDEYVILYAEFYTAISEAEDLNGISLNGKYALVCDIDLGGAEWTPIGTKGNPFTGEFDGNGYTVSNFKITTGRAYVGLFGYNKGVIKNLGVENFTVNVSYSGNVYAGGLVGYNSGDITNSYAAGEVSATASSSSTTAKAYAYAGGLAGYNSGGSILNGYATGKVSATASSSRSSAYAGGLVGYNSGGSILNCYATGEVSATSSGSSALAGGLVGSNSGDITNSYAAGNVSATFTSSRYAADAYAGGLVGINSGDILNSYAAGNVSATSSNYNAYAGGLVGINSGDITNSYAAGEVSATADDSAYAGGLVGYNNSGDITNCYRYSGQTFYRKNGSTTYSTASNTEGTAVSLDNLKSPSWVNENLWTAETEIWDFSNGYPTLDYEYIDSAIKIISTAEELKKLQGQALVLSYELNADIDLGDMEWTPVAIFYGTFNGNGYTVSNFKITTGRQYVGLFGYNKGVIKNLGVENFTVNVSYSGNVYAGGLVGYNSGDITNSYATGNVSATASSSNSNAYAYAGGLAGYNSGGSILNCYTTGNVSATASSSYSYAYAGGLVGYNSGDILNSYATGEVSATSSSARAGGLVGYNSGDITNSYAAGNVSATSTYTASSSNSKAYAGGLVGYNSGDITNSYAAGNVVSATSSSSYSDVYAGGLVGYNDGGSITNSYATGEVSATATAYPSYAYAGGLVGYNSGDITNSYATGEVSATSSYAYAGGLVGYNSGSILNSYATGDVSASSAYDAYAGGLAGYNSGGSILNCYATGKVSATASSSRSSAYAGGLVGRNSGSILNSYATGNVSATGGSYSGDYAYAGGLVGSNSSDITNSYATGNVSATATHFVASAYAGGLVGANSGDITNCYRYSGQTFYRKIGSDTYSTASNTLGTAKDLTTLQSVSFHTSTLGWDESVWKFVEGAFPTLKNAGTAIAG